MEPILRLDRNTQQIRLGINRGCQVARITSATLAVRRAGVWPQYETILETVDSPCCGPMQQVTQREINPTLFTLTATSIDGWVAVFEPPDAWLVDQPEGRYDGIFTTACGTVDVRFQLGRTARLNTADVPDTGCGDVSSTCPALPPAPPLSGPPTPPPPPPPAPPAPPGSPLRPKFFLGPANAHTTGTAGFMAAAVFLSGGTANGKTGSFTLTTTPGNFGWVAITAAVSAGGVTFADSIGAGGWSGAGQPGNYSTGDTINTSTVLFTDGTGVSWRLFRQDYINADPSARIYSIS